MSRRNLPKGLRRRPLSDGTFRYYLKTANSSRTILLDGDLNFALAQWRNHQIAIHLRHATITRITDLCGLFEACEIPVQAPTLQSHLVNQTRALVTFFREHGDPGFSDSIPAVTAYLQWRGSSHLYRASGEIRLLVRVFSWSRSHTTVQVGECPWTSGPVVEALQASTLKELGTAMAFYGRLPRVDAHRYDARQDTTTSGAQVPSNPVTDAVTIRDALTVPELRNHSVRQLRLDGRPDLAAALSKLPEAEVRTALVFGASATEAGNATRMVFGTQRAARLAAFRRTVGTAPKNAMKGSEKSIKSPPDE